MSSTFKPLKRASLFGFDSNAKTVKGQKKGFLTAILYLAPSEESDKINVCPHASPGCKAACLYSSGRGKMPSVIKARIQKTLEFFYDPFGFVEQLAIDIPKAITKAKNKGFTPCVRLNGTSDLSWESLRGRERVNLMERFPEIQFYDYTKNVRRMLDYIDGKMPKNYHLTFSKSEENDEKVLQVLKKGGNVAVVFEKFIPDSYLGYKVVDGDESDLRFLDEEGVVVGLKAKGDAKTDESGFVVIQ